ncbi:MAG: DUF131 domain-containing protein [Thermoplasmata archaeon]
MKRVLLPGIAFAAGIILVVTALLQGEASVALLLFIPILYGGGWLLGLGILLIMSSIVLWFFMLSQEETRSAKGESKYGGVVFIGPVPIVFGSDTKVTRIMLYVGLVIAALLFFTYVVLIW